MSFAEQVAAFSNGAKAKADAFVRELVGEISLSVILKSPVGDPALWQSKPPPNYRGGQFRANWRYGCGAINEQVSLGEIDPDGGPTFDRIWGELSISPPASVHYITNSLPYALPLERGHSSQAPLGMVGLTVIEFQQMASRARAKVTAIGATQWAA